MHQGLSDSEAVSKVLQGERDAFEVLVERYLHVVKAFGLSLTGNDADADDVAQEAFLRAYRSLPSLRQHDRFGPWLIRITRNIAVNLHKTRRRERDALQPPPPTAPDPQANIQDSEARSLLLREMDALPPKLREALVLHYFAGKTTGEIGRLLGTTKWAAAKRLQRARQILGERLVERLGTAVTEREPRPQDILGVMGLVAALPAHRPVTAAAAASTTAASLGNLWLWTVGGLSVLLLGGFSAWEAFRNAQLNNPVRVPPPVRSALQTPEPGKPSPDRKDRETSPATEAASKGRAAPVRGPALAGTVTDTQGRALPGALVVAYHLQNPPIQTTTNEKGGFRLAAMEGETYALRCNLEGYDKSFMNGVQAPAEGLLLRLQPRAELSGRVVNAVTRAPVERFKIAWDQATYDCADPDGQFKVHTVPGRSLTIYSVGYCVHHVPMPLEEIERAPGNELRVELTPAPVITGRVLDSDGAPIAGARIAVASKADPSSSVEAQWARDANGTLTSADDGSFRIESPPDSVGHVIATHKGYAPNSKAAPATHPGAAAYVELVLRKGGQVRGQVLRNGQPLKATVSLTYPGGTEIVQFGRRETSTDPEGRYSIEDLPPGPVELQASANLGSANHNIVTRRTAVVKGERTSTVNLEMPGENAILEGAVRLDNAAVGGDSQPLRGWVRVTVHADDGRQSSSCRVENGAYRLEGLQLGEAEIELDFHEPGWANRRATVPMPRPGTYRQDFDIRLGALRGIVQGDYSPSDCRVTVLAGTPPPDVTEWELPQLLGVGVEPDGTFQVVGLEPGTYTVVASVYSRRGSPGGRYMGRRGMPSPRRSEPSWEPSGWLYRVPLENDSPVQTQPALHYAPDSSGENPRAVGTVEIDETGRGEITLTLPH